MRFAPWLGSVVVLLSFALRGQQPGTGALNGSAGKEALRTRIESSPRLALNPVVLPMKLPSGQPLGMISWMAQDPKTSNIWIVQRGDDADPVLACNPKGGIVHAFGKGSFTLPHALRLDPSGTVWTVDAENGQVIAWSQEGHRLLTLHLSPRGNALQGGFDGPTDVAFAPGNRILVSDGYGRARVVEFSRHGRKLREWGSPGAGPGQFHLPHSIVVDEQGTVYVADRENGRIERFNLKGQFLGAFEGWGRTYALALGTQGVLWASMQPMGLPPGSPGWLVKLDRRTGKLLGYVPVPATGGLHGLAVDAYGQPMTDVGNTVVQFQAALQPQPAK